MKIPLAIIIIAASLNAAETNISSPPAAVLTIDPNGPSKPFSPVFAGLMTEEINHSYDGGLYGELIRNRVFQDNPTNAEGWTLTLSSNAEATMSLSEKYPLTEKLPISLKVNVTKAGTNAAVSVSNEGYWGIPLRPETAYRVSFYAAGNNAWQKESKEDPEPVLFRAPLTVSLQSTDGKTTYATATSPVLGGSWNKIDLTLTTGKDIPPSKDNHLVISANAPGTFFLSLVSLFPPTYKERPNGNRIDLMEKLAELKPSFLRFPGGNFLEGKNLPDRYDWKQTRGPLEFRPGHNGCWGYRSSDGLGLLEFMGWCEDLGMEPVLAIYAGYSLRQQAIQPGPLLEPYVEDALNEIEYLTGDAKTTYWGAQRAKDGRPMPFSLKYIEIGNEDDFDKSGSYDGRYAQFHDAIKKRYPGLQLIATTPVKSRKPDLIDEHFYKPTDWFVKEFTHYDKAARNGPKIFVGEWATTDIPAWGKGKEKRENPTPTLREALGDAAWMCSMERNADIVIMQCYAPLFVNVNKDAQQWKPDLIGYDALKCFVSPSWHAQQLFNTHRGNEVITATLNAEGKEPAFPHSVTRDKAAGLIYVKLVNILPQSRVVRIDLGKGTELSGEAELTTLSSSDPNAVNSLSKPDSIMPTHKKIMDAASPYNLTLEPNSLTILTLQLN